MLWLRLKVSFLVEASVCCQLYSEKKAYTIPKSNPSATAGRGVMDESFSSLVFPVEEGWCKVKLEMESCFSSGNKDQRQLTGAAINKWGSEELVSWRVAAQQTQTHSLFQAGMCKGSHIQAAPKACSLGRLMSISWDRFVPNEFTWLMNWKRFWGWSVDLLEQNTTSFLF